MSPTAISSWTARNRPQLRLALRITLASLVTFAIGRLLGLAQAYWAVLTALIVSQASVGGSLKATRDRFVGSLGGAAWGVAVSLALPHATIWGLALTLAVAIAPLAVITAINPAYRIASVTAVILLLTPTSQTAGPLVAASARMTEIALGSIVALAVSMLVLPDRAHGAVARSASKALEMLGELVLMLMAGISRPIDADIVQDLHTRIRKAILAAEAAGDEAARERRIGVLATADPEPLCRTLRRLHNDAIMIGRACQVPLSEPVRARLDGPAAGAAQAIDRFMRDIVQALDARQPAPAAAALEQALDAYGAAVTLVRAEHLTRALPDEMVGRIFGLGFALDQLRSHLRDLADRTDELARPSG